MHACACNDETAGLRIIDFLVQCFPDALTMADNFGCAAIHYASFSGCAQTVQYLLEKCPESVDLVEGNGALPIHDAVQNHRLLLDTSEESVSMVSILLKASPMAVRKRDDFGAFALHRAAKCANLAVFRVVHQVFPNAIFAVDNEGLLPMHYYSQREDKDLHLGLLQYMLKANPKSRVMKDDGTLFANDGGKLDSAALVGQSKGGWLRSFWGSSSSSANKTQASAADSAATPPAATAEDSALIARTAAALLASQQTSTSAGDNSNSSSSGSTNQGGSERSSALKGGHVRRKTVRPVRGSIHVNYHN